MQSTLFKLVQREKEDHIFGSLSPLTHALKHKLTGSLHAMRILRAVSPCHETNESLSLTLVVREKSARLQKEPLRLSTAINTSLQGFAQALPAMAIHESNRGITFPMNSRWDVSFFSGRSAQVRLAPSVLVKHEAVQGREWRERPNTAAYHSRALRCKL